MQLHTEPHTPATPMSPRGSAGDSGATLHTAERSLEEKLATAAGDWPAARTGGRAGAKALAGAALGAQTVLGLTGQLCPKFKTGGCLQDRVICAADRAALESSVP